MQKRSLFILAVAGLIGLFGGATFAAANDCTETDTCVVYVNDVAESTQEGTINEPFLTLSAAVAFVLDNNDYNTINIAGGTYGPSGGETLPIDIIGPKKDIFIQGGYSEDFKVFNVKSFKTVFDAEGETFITMTQGRGRIDGIVIKNANGAIKLNNSGIKKFDMEISNITFEKNDFDDEGMPVLDVSAQGLPTVNIHNNVFFENNGEEQPLFIFNGDIGNLQASHNLFSANGGDEVVRCEEALMYNNIVVNNDADTIIKMDGSCEFYNNSVVSNSALTGVILMANKRNEVINNLITHNEGGPPFMHDEEDDSTFRINGLYENESTPAEIGEDNFTCNPVYGLGDLVDASDIVLGVSSDCIDEGGIIEVVEDDYFGTTRPFDGDNDGSARYDVGAYERTLTGGPVEPIPQPEPVFEEEEEVDEVIEEVVEEIVEEVVEEPVEETPVVEVVEVVEVIEELVEEIVLVEEEPEDVGLCAGFTDVPGNHESCSAIKFAKSIGAMTGNPDGTFAPDDVLQRDEIVKISLETFKLFDPDENYCAGENPFPDLTVSEWSYQYICRGKQLEMITGYPEDHADAGKFVPDREVIRIEFLALILRNVDTLLPPISARSYGDTPSYNWYSPYAKYSINNDLYVGTYLFPEAKTTRVEVAIVLEKLNKKRKIPSEAPAVVPAVPVVEEVEEGPVEEFVEEVIEELVEEVLEEEEVVDDNGTDDDEEVDLQEEEDELPPEFSF